MRLVLELLNVTADWAAYNSSKKYATGELNKSATHLYTLLQCHPDLPDKNCSRCLRKLFKPLPDILYGNIGGWVLGSVCTMRYEVSSFYTGAPMVKLVAEADGRPRPSTQPDPDATANLPSTSQTSQPKRKKEEGYCSLYCDTFGDGCCILHLYCLHHMHQEEKESEIDDIDCPESLLLDLSTLEHATANFHKENKLGEGGFGEVYKGVLPDGQEIAVKRLAANSWQGLKSSRMSWFWLQDCNIRISSGFWVSAWTRRK